MRRLCVSLVCLVTLVSHASAATLSDLTHETLVYCDYLSLRASADGALLLWPQLFLTAGMLNDVSPESGIDAQLHPRLLVGVTYSAAAALRGTLLHAQAAHACAHYGDLALLHRFTQSNQAGTSKDGLRAKLQVLEQALIQAHHDAEVVHAAIVQAQATLDDDQLAQRRLDALYAAIHATRQALQTAPESFVATDIAKVLARLPDLAAQLEADASSVRRTQAWDISVRGGYDRVFGVQNRVPVFGSITFQASLGAIVQSDAEDAAVAAQAQWQRLRGDSPTAQAEQLLQQLRHTSQTDAERLSQLKTLRQQYAYRIATLKQVPGAESVRTARSVWYDLLWLDAEAAYLEAHLLEMSGLQP